MRIWVLATVVGMSWVTSTFASVTLQVPAEVPAGAPLSVSWTGEHQPNDFITLVAPETPEGEYAHYVYAKKNPAQLTAPDEPGDYEVRFLGEKRSFPTLGRAKIHVSATSATLHAPASAKTGNTISIEWTGPANSQDFITVVKADTPEGKYAHYVYARKSPVTIALPEEAGSYEVRYLTGQAYLTLARHGIDVEGASATVVGPSSAVEGARFEVQFTGGGSPLDFITIVPTGTPEGKYEGYATVRENESVLLTAPESPGAYEVRYLTAKEYRTLAKYPIDVGPAAATLGAPSEVVGGERFAVDWTGPGNRADYITIVAPSLPDTEYGDYKYVWLGNPVEMFAPLEAGEYELRYSLGASRKTLARRKILVSPPATLPGELQVIHSGSGSLALPENAAVELILDASGSMLKKEGGQRRIDLAKEVLVDLVKSALPAGTPFALRVFGHKEAGSCRTDLELSLAPLDPAAAAKTIAGIEAMNLAKTPIAQSLSLVADDLKITNQVCRVVLVTDGEETCGGDPAAVVEKLREKGLDVRINIVGLAIDDAELRTTFRFWADLGGGSYHDAANAEALGESIRASLRERYDVLNSNAEIVAIGVVGGAILKLPAGDYNVRPHSLKLTRPVSVPSDRLTVLDLESN